MQDNRVIYLSIYLINQITCCIYQFFLLLDKLSFNFSLYLSITSIDLLLSFLHKRLQPCTRSSREVELSGDDVEEGGGDPGGAEGPVLPAPQVDPRHPDVGADPQVPPAQCHDGWPRSRTRVSWFAFEGMNNERQRQIKE